MDNEDGAMNYILNSREEDDRSDSGDGTSDGNHRVIDHSQQRQFPLFRPLADHAPPSRHRYHHHHPSRASEQQLQSPYEDAQRSLIVNHSSSSMDVSGGDQMSFDRGSISSPFPFNIESLWSLMPSDEDRISESNSQLETAAAASVVVNNNNNNNNGGGASGDNNDRTAQQPTATATTTVRITLQPLSSTTAVAGDGSNDENWEDRRNASLLRGIGSRRRFAARNGATVYPIDEDDHLRSRRRMSHRMMTIREHRNNQAGTAPSSAAAAAATAAGNARPLLLDNSFLYFQHPAMLSDTTSRRPDSPSHATDGNRNSSIPRMFMLRRDLPLVNTDDPSSQRRRNEYILPVFGEYEAGLPSWRFSTMPVGMTNANSNSVQSQVRIALQQHSILNTQLVSACPKILEGCHVACNKTCFIDEMTRNGIIQNCKALGAEVYPSYCAQITHFISPFQAGEEYELACSDSKIIVSLQWLDDCISAKSYIEPYKPVVHYPLRSWTCIPGMKNLVISVTGFVGEERSDLKFLIKSTGATYSGALQRKENTHLLCSMPEGEKYKKALEWKIKVVNARWIFDCVAQWTHLPEVLYQDIFVNR